MTEMTKTILSEESMPQVEVDFMNATHSEEVKLVKQLGEAISSYQELDGEGTEQVLQITQLVDEWFEHTTAHFERENELMLEVGFPVYTIHYAEHEKALNNMDTVVKHWKQYQDIDELAYYVFELWPEWFEAHVNSMDNVTACFAVANGFDPHTPKK